MKIFASTALNTTLEVEDREADGVPYSTYPRSFPVVAAAGTTAIVKFSLKPTHPCWGHEFRFTLVGTNAPVRRGRMSSDCTYNSIVTDSWSHLTPAQQALRNAGKVSVSNVTMTPAPVCDEYLWFSAKVTNNTNRMVTKVRLDWSKAPMYDVEANIAPGASRTYRWREVPWFDDGTNFQPVEMEVGISPTDLPKTDRVWTKDLQQSCTISVGLLPLYTPPIGLAP